MKETFIDQLWQECEGWVRMGTWLSKPPHLSQFLSRSKYRAYTLEVGNQFFHSTAKSSGESDIGGRGTCSASPIEFCPLSLLHTKNCAAP